VVNISSQESQKKQKEEAVGKPFWTFSLAHASLPEDLRV